MCTQGFRSELEEQSASFKKGTEAVNQDQTKPNSQAKTGALRGMAPDEAADQALARGSEKLLAMERAARERKAEEARNAEPVARCLLSSLLSLVC